MKLKKEPDKKYDKEAIQVKVKGLGVVGYVANSPYTVKGDSVSAGRLYDRIGAKARGKIVAVIGSGAICKVTDIGINNPVLGEEHTGESELESIGQMKN